MAELKTQANDASVDAFLSGIEDSARRADCARVLELMKDVTGAEPLMWGASIVGFGRYRYRYASGREGEWFITGFSPRKNSLTLYIMAGFDRYDDLLARLGRYSTGKSCLYVKRLSDVDADVLRELVAASAQHVRETWTVPEPT
ncbi:MAG TPA: DUF1801 domain-containing protein [Longimicrobiales bacterium]